MFNIENLTFKIIRGYKITLDEAKKLWSADFCDLMHGANQIRQNLKGNKIKLCSIVNAKSGNCSEDCKFCSQASSSTAKIKKHPLVEFDVVNSGYNNSQKNEAQCFGIVTSGKKVSSVEMDKICRMIKKINSKSKNISVSLGEIEKKHFKKLKDSGVKKIHCNLETSESFFPNICSTHQYLDKMLTITDAKEAGLKVCCGGLFGIGETFIHRLELAFKLRNLNVDSVPMNFHNPIKGTVLENLESLSPLEILYTIAVFRYILPDKDISVCGGRETNLRDMQSYIFSAGANGMMVGGYLTSRGRSVREDLQMIKDLGLSVDYEK